MNVFNVTDCSLKKNKMANFITILNNLKKKPIRTYPFVQIYAGCQLFAECTAASTQPLMYSPSQT